MCEHIRAIGTRSQAMASAACDTAGECSTHGWHLLVPIPSWEQALCSPGAVKGKEDAVGRAMSLGRFSRSLISRFSTINKTHEKGDMENSWQ